MGVHYPLWWEFQKFATIRVKWYNLSSNLNECLLTLRQEKHNLKIYLQPRLQIWQKQLIFLFRGNMVILFRVITILFSHSWHLPVAFWKEPGFYEDLHFNYSDTVNFIVFRNVWHEATIRINNVKDHQQCTLNIIPWLYQCCIQYYSRADVCLLCFLWRSFLFKNTLLF